ncbi:hypothetical protein HGRIS_004891 [Hohenbuehelia grisea]|uniref:FMN hydroxy acid dehydrogenase domain-containing protein n=1 Tax=Hohenbuehelia grisea TaxID=104357 RepID=A0ABR3JDJ5_9AGAR
MSSVVESPASADNGTILPPVWSKFMLDVYIGRKGPGALGTVSFEEIEAKAKEASKDHIESFNFAYDGAGTGATTRANVKAFSKYAIIPRMLVNASTRSLETTIFGVKHPSPILMAPIGLQGVHHPDAELASARAGGKLGIPFIMSTPSSRCIEEVAQANGNGTRWFQLYRPRSDDVCLSLLNRAKANGFSALVITLDAVQLGWRHNDLRVAYMPYRHGFGNQVGRSDPVFMARYGKQPIYDEHPEFPYDQDKLDKLILEGDEVAKERAFIGMEWAKECNAGKYWTWEDLKFVRENWDGPLVLKGVQSVEDAEGAIDYGADGIVVSNHGGRQIDGALPSLVALDRIMQSTRILEAQKAGKLTVLFDSGVRTGSDIIKAIALGAQGVLLGRPWLYGLMIAGEEGVAQVLKHTLADLDVTLGLSGWKNLTEIHGGREAVITKVDL